MIGYAVASHDRVLLGGIGALAAAAIHMVFCWLAVRLRLLSHQEARTRTVRQVVPSMRARR